MAKKKLTETLALAVTPSIDRLTSELESLDLTHDAERRAIAVRIIDSLHTRLKAERAERDRLDEQIDRTTIEFQQVRYSVYGRHSLQRKPNALERHEMARQVYGYLQSRKGERTPPRKLAFLIPKEVRLRELVDYWNENHPVARRIHSEGDKAGRTYHVSE